MTGAGSSSSLEADEPGRQLGVVKRLALVDALLLAVLVTFSLLDLEVAVSIVGAVHGGLFLTLVTLVAAGAGERLWGWWFAVATVVTGGAVGAVLGAIASRVRARAARRARHPHRATARGARHTGPRLIARRWDAPLHGERRDGPRARTISRARPSSSRWG